MILLLFISFCFGWFFFRYFENKRKDRPDQQWEKRKKVYEQLLETLKNKEVNKNNNQ